MNKINTKYNQQIYCISYNVTRIAIIFPIKKADLMANFEAIAARNKGHEFALLLNSEYLLMSNLTDQDYRVNVV